MLKKGFTFVHRNALALIALFAAIGGTSYAALQIPPNSVGRAQLKAGAVGTRNLADGAVTMPKIGTAAVTSTKLGSGAVTSRALSEEAKRVLRSDLVPGVAMAYSANLPALRTLGTETQLLTVQRPNGGAPPWGTGQTVALAAVTYSNAGDTVQVKCRIDGIGGGYATPSNIQGGTIAFAGPATNPGAVHLVCLPDSPTFVANVDVRILNASLTLIPASVVSSG